MVSKYRQPETYWINGDAWLSWTPEQRGEITTHLNNNGIPYGIKFEPTVKREEDTRRDYEEVDEYQEPYR